MKYFLAVDIGASSGRHMLTHMEEDRMVLEEVHRFYNGMTEKNGHKIWDVDTLFEEIKIGMKKCASLGKIPESMGIDTWAVDFVLLDKNGEESGMQWRTEMQEPQEWMKECLIVGGKLIAKNHFRKVGRIERTCAMVI